ncbi:MULTISPECIES: DUF4149 domain-containing protein [Chromobacterium]|uniref:DUF4149 domain-containing protein n=1 Tax=Chromobacterium TaxID=535 RepID=UPI001886E3BA|nr:MULTISPECIES: DUF4149 domain-containing protein [Chromobacterium]QOZ82815.1 DUF4149 domain-containing protein [Chromobacterium sp. Rain0013]WON82884.1 DUF4149 domain-containing protein [Chromobacterium haemolyticum]
MDGLRSIAKTFWIGGLWVIGIIVAPVLFAMLDRVTAGMVAGKLFASIAWVGLVCGAILLVDHIRRNGAAGVKESGFWLVMGMLACTLINHFAVTPIIANLKAQMNHAAEGLFGGGFATWHAISSLIYLVQSLMGLVYVWRHD